MGVRVTANCYNSSRVCVDGVVTAHGASCVTRCRAGYTPSEAVLFCSDGEFYPPTFTCRALGCTAPTVMHSVATSCQEGEQIPSGGICTPRCSAGSEPSVSALTCSLGRFTPPTFSCLGRRCAAPNVQFADTPSCGEGATISSGGVCTPLCDAGFVSSVELLRCHVGEFSPSNFTCSSREAFEQQIVTMPVAVALTGSLAFATFLVLVLIFFSRQKGVRLSPALAMAQEGRADSTGSWSSTA